MPVDLLVVLLIVFAIVLFPLVLSLLGVLLYRSIEFFDTMCKRMSRMTKPDVASVFVILIILATSFYVRKSMVEHNERVDRDRTVVLERYRELTSD